MMGAVAVVVGASRAYRKPWLWTLHLPPGRCTGRLAVTPYHPGPTQPNPCRHPSSGLRTPRTTARPMVFTSISRSNSIGPATARTLRTPRLLGAAARAAAGGALVEPTGMSCASLGGISCIGEADGAAGGAAGEGELPPGPQPSAPSGSWLAGVAHRLRSRLGR